MRYWSGEFVRQLSLAAMIVSAAAVGRAAEPTKELSPWRVSPAGQFPADGRLGSPRTLRDKYHPWTPPETLADWERAREQIRTQLLVACGLWPLPEKTPLTPVVHGRVDRQDYTVERVFFSSRPGMYCTGSLYRPKGFDGPRPGVLCPHGHWADGRFYDAGEAAAQKQIETGAESRMNAARFPLQARMAQLARMGCIVFHYDMIGYADQGPLDHRIGFSDAEGELRSQNIMGLQTWNSLRALDFVESLPDVDKSRIGITGASGGGTQTFVLCAIDPRPAVAFPAVMVSTNMQGGCVCENASWLRLGLNNVALAACFAPKPLGMTGANDWTIDIETKGLPELKQVWQLYKQPDLVQARCFPQFGHNYNETSRKVMYEWFNQHLLLGSATPIEEQDFTPLTREEATVFTAEHPRPDDALPAEALRERLTAEQQLAFSKWLEAAQQQPDLYRQVIRPAAEVLLGGASPKASDIVWEVTGRATTTDAQVKRGYCGRRGTTERIPWVLLQPLSAASSETATVKEVTVWIDGRGKHGLFGPDARPLTAVRNLLQQGESVFSADVFLTGEYLPMEVRVDSLVNHQFAGYSWGYNRPLLTERVRDVLTAVATAQELTSAPKVHLLGTREAGLWILLARSRLGNSVQGTLVDMGNFTFGALTDTSHPDFLPGAMRFGGLGGLLAAAGSVTIEVANCGPETEQELQPFVTLGGTLKQTRQRLSPAFDD
ncbi:MAG: alpha/beta hydrolase family protein [Planctomycetaceae bacterium]